MFFMYGFHIHIARKMCTLRFKESLYIVMNPIFVIFLFSLPLSIFLFSLPIFQIPRPGGGGREGFILDFYVNVASKMLNLGFKGLLHILMNPIFFNFLHFRLTQHILVT